jgi:hypothetical protein
MIVYLPYSYFHQGPVVLPLKIEGEAITDFGFPAIFLLTFGFISYLFFVYGIYQLRQLLRLFEKRMIFEQATIWLLNQIGGGFLISSVLGGIALFVYNSFHRGSASLDFSSGFSSFLFTMSLGLFFMVLGEVFNIAKTMKEENELTV